METQAMHRRHRFTETCPLCRGTGRQPIGHPFNDGTPVSWEECSRCGGWGMVEPDKPLSCGGSLQVNAF